MLKVANSTFPEPGAVGWMEPLRVDSVLLILLPKEGTTFSVDAESGQALVAPQDQLLEPPESTRLPGPHPQCTDQLSTTVTP